MTHLTAEERGAIIYGHTRGDSARAIARTLGRSKTAVVDIIARYKETGSTEPKSRTGRPPLLNTPDRSRLKTLVTSDIEKNRRLCLSQVTTLWQTREDQVISEKTIRRALHKTGLNSCASRNKPLISAVNQQIRLQWALNHQGWKLAQWKKVLFSDESTFTQFQKSSTDRVWREANEVYHPACLSATVKHSPSRMFWGCFSWEGLGPIIPLYGSVTGASHAEVLAKYAIPTLKARFPGRSGWFQEDNARPHTAKVAAAVREQHDVRSLPWPAQSPDLNPIENLWHMVKQEVRRRSPSSLLELESVVKDAWSSIPPEEIQNLVASMPRRVKACIEAKGGHTKY